MLSLTYIGHSAFALSDGTNSVLVDPFITGNPVATVSSDAFSPNTILLTHAHNDHVGDTVSIATRAGSHVIALFEIANWLGSKGVETDHRWQHGRHICVRWRDGEVHASVAYLVVSG